MRRPSLIIALIIITSAVAVPLRAQPIPIKIAEAEYQTVPLAIRIENSGIYAVASFNVAHTGIVELLTSDHGEVIQMGQAGALKKRSAAPSGSARDFLSVRSFAAGPSLLSDNGTGTYRDEHSNAGIKLTTLGRHALRIRSTLPGAPHSFDLPFPGDLAYAALIGIDAAGDYFLLIERYTSELPLHVRREVLVLDAEGMTRSVLAIPDIKYLSTEKEFTIDPDGTLYHMMTTKEKLLVFRWEGLTKFLADTVTYPAQYEYSLHYNQFVTAAEEPGEAASVQQPSAVASRTLALRIAESYAMHQYVIAPSNLSASNVTGPDGDVVRTPPWLLPGFNARVPYMWGGFSTLAQFDAGLRSGKYAGDINTSGVSSYAVGVDCSGFVSRCWQMSSHYSTSMMPAITTEYASWDSLKPGDAIHKVGHVRLFIERTANGGFRVVEAAGRNWDVSYWTFAPSDLQGVYTPRCYNSMERTSSFRRPTLTSVIQSAGTYASLTWECDTIGVLGFRIYASTDGVQWTLAVAEAQTGTRTSHTLPVSTAAAFYRVSSVMNDAAHTESDWSNAMGASAVRAAKQYLIVDGFERQTGSWQNPAHTLAVRYGLALQGSGVSFSTMKNSRLKADSASVWNYDGVVWFLGDEGTEQETFSADEQAFVKVLLEGGKKLFVSGSEIGWDLSQSGSALDKQFYAHYLKAAYKADNAGATAVKSEPGGFYNGIAFNIGQVYVEDYPDAIDSANGSAVCLRFDNNKAAGVQYTGTFGASRVQGKLVHLSFALETVGDNTVMNSVIKRVIEYFEQQTTAVQERMDRPELSFALDQNYPNPFNPSTTISFTVPADGRARLTIFNALGQQVAVLFDGEARAGKTMRVTFDASGCASGAYVSRLEFNGRVHSRMMQLIK